MRDGTIPLSGMLLDAARRLDQLLNQPNQGFTALTDDQSIETISEAVALLVKAVPNDRLAQAILRHMEAPGASYLALHLVGALLGGNDDKKRHATQVADAVQDPMSDHALRQVGCEIDGSNGLRSSPAMCTSS